MRFTEDEKIAAFNKIEQNYFNQNFGSMSKMDLETLLFSVYIEHCLKNYLPFDDYSLSKQLGITQSRIRTLKERKELRYPYEGFNWKEAFAESIENAKYDSRDHRIKMIVQDVNVMNEIRNVIEIKGWYDECSLNKKLLCIPLDCFVEICDMGDTFDGVFSEEIKNKVRKISKSEDPSLKEFLSDFSKDGLKSFLMSASKELVSDVLKLLPFGGVGKIAFEHLLKQMEGV